MLDHSCQVQRHPHAERGVDLYETPEVAVEALLRVETLPHLIWEPACGPGKIVGVLRKHGHKVLATDIVDYGQPLIWDFLVTDGFAGMLALEHSLAIVTNPPYQLAAEFVQHALKLCPSVYMLLRFAFYESDRRTDILEHCGLRAVYCFRKRLPMMHRDGWEGKKANSGMAFAWFCWDRSYQGDTVLRRISWEK